jgi:hypothetical protein
VFDEYRSPYAKSEILLAGMRDDARVENQAIAARLTKIGELFTLRRRENGETRDWAVDTWTEVGAEVSAALGCTIAMAGSYLYYARAMTDRLPAVATVFCAGDIDFRTFQTICYRTELVAEDTAMADVDRQLAARARGWGSLSKSRLATAIDRQVCKVDPAAVRRKREEADKRGVEFWTCSDGLSGMSATMLLDDAAGLETRLEALADSVCDADPRGREVRLADALGALGAGQDRLSCRCEQETCPAGGRLPSPAPVTIHIVAEQATLDGTSDTPGYHQQTGELIPADQVAELAREATVRPLVHPGDAAHEAGYTPSRKLADFVRARDLTCRAPHCDRPAVQCDIDHTVPHADGGPTHASNLKCLCRLHHILKTFWGWKDQQQPDGTVIWNLPGNQTHVTLPGSALVYPSLCAPTAELPPPTRASNPERCADPTAMMPRRKTTRDQDRARRIAAERAQNLKIRQARRTDWDDICFGARTPASHDDDPPPF